MGPEALAAPVAPAESSPAATEMPKSAAGDTPTTDTGTGLGTTAAPRAEPLAEAAPSAGTSPVLVLSAACLLAGVGLSLLALQRAAAPPAEGRLTSASLPRPIRGASLVKSRASASIRPMVDVRDAAGHLTRSRRSR
jgi:hypothetical protein